MKTLTLVLALVLSSLLVTGCSTYGPTPVNICLLAMCEQQADTGDGDLKEGNQDADVEVGL